MKIGMVGLDTSHCEIFTRLLNDGEDPYHIGGGQVTHAVPVFSSDLALSKDRFPRYRDIVTNKYGVELADDVEALMTSVDAVLLTTVDGRNHLDWYRKLVPYRKPIFIDKPIVLSSAEMDEVILLAKEYGTPTMSSSSLRFADPITHASSLSLEKGYFYGPLPLQPTMPGYFWYGIHLVEMIVTLFGSDVVNIVRHVSEKYETVLLTFLNGKEVILHADYAWHDRFGAVLHTKTDVMSVQLWKESRPYYASLLEQVITFFQTGRSPVSLSETAKLIRLIERINMLNHDI